MAAPVEHTSCYCVCTCLVCDCNSTAACDDAGDDMRMRPWPGRRDGGGDMRTRTCVRRARIDGTATTTRAPVVRVQAGEVTEEGGACGRRAGLCPLCRAGGSS
jgi:hypothetical protein